MKFKGNNETNPSSLPVAGGVKRMQALFNLQRRVITKNNLAGSYLSTCAHYSICRLVIPFYNPRLTNRPQLLTYNASNLGSILFCGFI